MSSFGTQLGYPVMARIVNLPIEIRNGRKLGGGKVVGWLVISSLTICFFPLVQAGASINATSGKSHGIYFEKASCAGIEKKQEQPQKARKSGTSN